MSAAAAESLAAAATFHYTVSEHSSVQSEIPAGDITESSVLSRGNPELAAHGPSASEFYNRTPGRLLDRRYEACWSEHEHVMHYIPSFSNSQRNVALQIGELHSGRT